MTGDTTPLLVEHHDGWSEFRLNRPQSLNAINDDLIGALHGALDAVEADKTVCALLLTGNGRGFCSGQDLGNRDPRLWDAPPDLAQSVRQRYNTLITRLRDIRVPSICAVNGVAAGAGIGLALACDITLAVERARFVVAFSRIGLIPDAGVSWHLTRRLGEARATGLAMTGGQITAAEAKACGLIWDVLTDEDLMPTAADLAARLAAGPIFGLLLNRQAIRAAAANDFAAHLELEADLQGSAGLHPDYAEGVTSFLEKRAPSFSGRLHEMECPDD